MYAGPYVAAGSVGHSYRELLLPQHTPIVTPHFIYFIEQYYVQQLHHARIALPMCCYLAHAHPTMFYIHQVSIVVAANIKDGLVVHWK